MTLSSVNFQKIAAVLITLVIPGYLLIVGKPIFIPIAFGIFLAFMLYPICDLLEGYGMGRPWAIGLTFTALFSLMAGLVGLFSAQLIAVVSELSGLEFKLDQVIREALLWVENRLNIDIRKEWIEDNLASIIQTPLNILATSIRSSTTLLANLILTVIYCVLFLLYRTSLKNFILSQVHQKSKDTATDIIRQTQKVVQQYLYGLSMVILILGMLNSLGLWFIGIDYPFFWGFLSAFLAIIPYVGTFVGAFLPFLYSLVTTQTFWQPTAVVILFVVIQQLEGNIITPKLIGSNISVNPLAAIFSLILGGTIWGIAGLILALPAVAIVKITLDNIEPLKPIGALLSSDIYHKEVDFESKYDKGIYRVFRMFSKKEE